MGIFACKFRDRTDVVGTFLAQAPLIEDIVVRIENDAVSECVDIVENLRIVWSVSISISTMYWLNFENRF